jgi:hypothetical protein
MSGRHPFKTVNSWCCIEVIYPTISIVNRSIYAKAAKACFGFDIISHKNIICPVECHLKACHLIAESKHSI